MRQHPVAHGHAFPHDSSSLLRTETTPEFSMKILGSSEGRFEGMVVVSGHLLGCMSHGFLPAGKKGTCWSMVKGSNSMATHMTQIVDHAEIGVVDGLKNVQFVDYSSEDQVARSDILPVVLARIGTDALKRFALFQAERAKQLDVKASNEMGQEFNAVDIAAKAAALARR